jgi:spore germination protein GerM
MAHAVDIYLIGRGGRLTRLQRNVIATGVPGVIAALLAGPTPDEAALGVHTALSDVQMVRTVETSDAVAAVDLASTFTDLGGEDQRAAIAQLVFTLTGAPGVQRVSFTLDGRPIEIPRGDGTLTTGSVSRDSYDSLRPVS